MRPSTSRQGPYQIQIKFTTVDVLGEDNSLRLVFPVRILVFGKMANCRSFGEHLGKKIHRIPPAAPATVQNCDFLGGSA